MCSIIGYLPIVEDSSLEEDRRGLLVNLFIQSEIRGRHATGLAYATEGMVRVLKESLPAREFLTQESVKTLFAATLPPLIGHCRYSTSGDWMIPHNNHPIKRASDNRAVVHNGVITQEAPEQWESLYNVVTESTTDSELLLHLPVAPLLCSASTIAGAILSDQALLYFRNEFRPLWYIILPRLKIFLLVSTLDIFLRANTQKESYHSSLIPPNIIFQYTFNTKLITSLNT